MQNRLFPALYLMFLLFTVTTLQAAEKAAPLSALGRMTIKEITVFKDGHCFVAQEGLLPTDSQGNVLIDQLPAPIIGTFWSYSTEKNARLAGVVASQRRVAIPRTALNLREMLEANVGADVIITEVNSNRYPAKVVGFPERSAQELASINPPNTPERLPEKGNYILLRTTEGTKMLDVGRIQDVIFKGEPNSSSATEEFRNLLTLKLDWNNRRPSPKAGVGVFYLQKGIRWIPSYRVDLDGNGKAVVKLQATLLNEMTDLVDTDVNLVIGVPTFNFKDTLDPLALQQTLAELSSYFQNPSADGNRNNAFLGNFSNAIMTQNARMGEHRTSMPQMTVAATGDSTPVDGGKNEDTFIFTLKKITLQRGERMIVPVAEYTLPYRDLFTLELPFAPPPEVRGNLNSQQQQELARLFNAPKVMHKVRLTNTSKHPLTTAPALILSNGRVLAQGMMTYTAPTAETDLSVTTAVDVSSKKTDVEKDRTPNALVIGSSHYHRINLNGIVSLTNHRQQPATLEVTRYVLGNATMADQDGKSEKLNIFENEEYVGRSDYPYWWHWYGWPNWWSRVNGTSRITWKLTLEPGKKTELKYDWHYFWN